MGVPRAGAEGRHPLHPVRRKGPVENRDPNLVVFIEQKLLYRQRGPVPDPHDDYSIPLGLAGLDVSIPYNPVLEANVVPTLEKIMAAARNLL